MKNQILGVFVCILLLATIIPLSVSSNETTNKTIYVDDDNTSGPWDGSMEHPYRYIQDAVNVASDGDTVFVFNGTYYENIIINKSINLLGDDVYTTAINGGNAEYVIRVKEDHCVISTFTIKNGDYGIVAESSLNLTVQSLNIAKVERGIKLKRGFHNTIIGNTINYCSRGIYLETSKYNIIQQNSVHNNTHGISIWGSSGNSIKNNIISWNTYGIELGDSYGNEITENNIIQNGNIDLKKWQRSGIFLADKKAVKNTIWRNNFRNNSRGVFLYFADKNILLENNFLGNDDHVVFFGQINNHWRSNYWDDWIGFLGFGFKIIKGRLHPRGNLPWFDFDWHPAREPYDIP